MKLLLDQNISRKLLKELEDLFPGSSHVCLLGLQKASDEKIWDYAHKNGYTIVTQDTDFYEKSLVYGYPPKIIWLRTGNISTQNIERLLKHHFQDIISLEEDKTLSCLQIY